MEIKHYAIIIVCTPTASNQTEHVYTGTVPDFLITHEKDYTIMSFLKLSLGDIHIKESLLDIKRRIVTSIRKSDDPPVVLFVEDLLLTSLVTELNRWVPFEKVNHLIIDPEKHRFISSHVRTIIASKTAVPTSPSIVILSQETPS